MARLVPLWSRCSQKLSPKSAEHFARWGHEKGEAWRICVECSDGKGVLPLVFGRREDVELAIKAIEGLDIWELDGAEECRARLNAFGRDRLMQMCVEAMRW